MSQTEDSPIREKNREEVKRAKIKQAILVYKMQKKKVEDT
jgi:hypothetical protein